MRIIYIFRRGRKDPYSSAYPSGIFNKDYWYNGGYIAGIVIQFLAGAGIGYVVGSVVRGVFRALCMM